MSAKQAFSLTPAELREKWIEALESDRFKQTTGALKRYKRGDDGEPSGHCCLGVLCEVYAEHGGSLHRRRNEDGTVVFDGCSGELPDDARQAVGLCTGLGEADDGTDLADMNDRHISFQEIAKVLRDPPLGLLEEQP